MTRYPDDKGSEMTAEEVEALVAERSKDMPPGRQSDRPPAHRLGRAAEAAKSRTGRVTKRGRR